MYSLGIPHEERKQVSFVDFRDDGYVVRKHVGLVGDGTEKSKKEFLLDVLRGYEEADNDFIVKSPVTWNDEWLHSYFYFNDTPPTKDVFLEVMSDYLAFEFEMKVKGKEYLFENKGDDDE